MDNVIVLNFTLNGTTVSNISGHAVFGPTKQVISDLFTESGGVFTFDHRFECVAVNAKGDVYTRFDGEAADASTGFLVNGFSADINGEYVSLYSASEVKVTLMVAWE